MDSHPLISICIFNYNYGRFLRDAVAGALAQTYSNIEVVVSDNASTDDSMDVLSEFSQDARLRVSRNHENIGWMRNHKRALQLARGTYAVAIPADDVLLPTFCEDTFRFLNANRSTTDAVYTSVAYTDVALTPQLNGSCIGLLPGSYVGGRNEFRELLRMDHIRWPAMLASRETLLRFSDFDETLHAQADWDALLAMSAAGIRFGYIPRVGALIRRHADQCSADGSFVGTVKEVEDYLTIHERYVTPEHHWRFHGMEQTLLADFERLYAALQQYGGLSFSSALQKRAQLYCAWLRQLIASAAPARPVEVPRTSVIVTTNGNRPADLARALASLATQNETNFEVILVQSGAESLEAWVATLALPAEVRFFYTPQHITTAAARIIGLRLSIGEFIAYIDDDTEFLPDHLSYARHIFNETVVAAVCANATVEISGNRMEGLLGIGDGRIGPEYAPMVPAAALIHRFSCVEKVGYFAENLPILDDWLFLLSLATHVSMTARGDVSVIVHVNQNFFDSGASRVGINAYFSILDMIYGVIPVPSAAETDQRARYRNRLLLAWPAPGAGPEATATFMLALAGKELTLVR